MTIGFTGGCMCGAIRYECEAEPIAMGNCHCRDCQRATGSGFAAAVLVPISAVKISGEVKYHEVTGDSGAIVRRGFCSNCGARLFVSQLRRPTSWTLWRAVLTIRAGFAPKQTSM
jgi:hypothetical protein